MSPARTARSREGTCFVVASLRAGGAERSIARLAVHRSSRTRTALITLDSSKHDFYFLSPGVERTALGVLRNDASGLRRVVHSVRRIFLLRRAIKRTGCATVVSFVDRTNILVLVATIGLGLSVVVSERVNPEFSPIGLSWSIARRFAYKWAAKVVVQSERVANWAKSFLASDRIVVIPNGIGSTGLTGGPREPTVVGIGRLVPQKGFDILLKAFAHAIRLDPNWRLVLFGDGPERERLLALAEHLKIRDRVSFPGIVRDVQKELVKASIFVLSSRFEGFPNALLEAMSAGCGVISTDCPSGPAEILRSGVDGLLVPPNDAEALGAALSVLMHDPESRQKFGVRAREVTHRFSLTTEFESWDRILDQSSA